MRDCNTELCSTRSMSIRLVRPFGTGGSDTYEISPASLEIEVEPGNAADEILMLASIQGDFAYRSGSARNQFLIEIGQYSDLDRIREALTEIAGLAREASPEGSPDPYAVRDLVRELQRRREEAIMETETGTIEDEIATGVYGDEFF